MKPWLVMCCAQYTCSLGLLCVVPNIHEALACDALCPIYVQLWLVTCCAQYVQPWLVMCYAQYMCSRGLLRVVPNINKPWRVVPNVQAAMSKRIKGYIQFTLKIEENNRCTVY